MPWLNDGTFERITNNTQENGISLWQQDLSANIKVIAYRHDFHDHDLASGIAETLNLDGYNAMRANLNMGGYKIVNTIPGSANADMATFGQVIGEMTYDALGPGILAIFNNNGDEVAQVTITPGSGGSGTVQQITVGPGLVASQNPIVSVADLDLAPAATPGQSYGGGIAGIVIDDYGRVTQVTTGGFANTNLGKVLYTNAVEITSSTGTNTTINGAFGGANGRAGVMTRDQVDELALSGKVNGANTWQQEQTFGNVRILADFDLQSSNTDVGPDVTWNTVGSNVLYHLGSFVTMAGLPTSAPAEPNRIWNDGGTLKIT